MNRGLTLIGRNTILYERLFEKNKEADFAHRLLRYTGYFMYSGICRRELL